MPISRSTADIDVWLDELWDLRGTDLLLTAGAPPLMRVDGDMRPVTGGEMFSPISVERVVKAVVGPDLVASYEAEREIEAWTKAQRHAA